MHEAAVLSPIRTTPQPPGYHDSRQPPRLAKQIKRWIDSKSASNNSGLNTPEEPVQMAITYMSSTDPIDWNHLAALFVRAALGDRSPDLLETTFRGSQVTVFAHEDGRLIGAGRALSDHILWSAIFDVALDPTYQGQGIGAELVRRIIEAAGTPNVMLKSVPGKEPFYAKFGFKPMSTGMEANHFFHGSDSLHDVGQR